MRSSHSGLYFPYLGIDLSARYAATPRASDVCALQPADTGFEPRFWQWQWDPPEQPLTVEPILPELRAARCIMIDGPQALARAGARLREAERQCRTAGKTGPERPRLDRPYGGFIRSSLELFAELYRQGLAISPPALLGGVNEYYPAAAWQWLARGRKLKPKTSRTGRRERAGLLRAWGVRLDPRCTPGHDGNDACLGALLAAAADGQVADMAVVHRGPAPEVDEQERLREGPIVVPETPTR